MVPLFLAFLGAPALADDVADADEIALADAHPVRAHWAPERASCRSADGLARVELVQPDESTWASGPGECWLTLNEPSPKSPLRLYIGFEGSVRGVVDERADTAVEWVQKNRVFKNHIELVESGTTAVGGREVAYHLVQGYPPGSQTLREAIVAIVPQTGNNIVVLAHYDANNRRFLQERAFGMLASLTLHNGTGQPTAPTEPLGPTGDPAPPEKL